MSERERIVIVGGGPAGLSTARAYRECGGAGEVTMLAAEHHLPYRRPPLTKDYLRGESDASELPLEASDWYGAHRIEVRHDPAVALDCERRIVTTQGGEELGFTACVLATGSEPARLPVPGADEPDVMVVRTREDSDRLAAAARPGRRIAVIGSGFIGCEAAASLARRGAEIAMVSDEQTPQAARLGADAGARIAGWLHDEGVELHLGRGVEAIERERDGWSVLLADGDRVAADAVLMGAGAHPRLRLAERAGLPMAEEGGVAVDAGLRADPATVLAAGDIAAALHPLAGRRIRVEHWGEALNQGKVAGAVLAGHDARWDVAPGFWSTIGEHTLKYVAWGDGHDEARFTADEDGAFSVLYGRDGVCVGMLTHDRDEAYERGRELVESGARMP